MNNLSKLCLRLSAGLYVYAVIYSLSRDVLGLTTIQTKDFATDLLAWAVILVISGSLSEQEKS